MTICFGSGIIETTPKVLNLNFFLNFLFLLSVFLILFTDCGGLNLFKNRICNIFGPLLLAVPKFILHCANTFSEFFTTVTGDAPIKILSNFFCFLYVFQLSFNLSYFIFVIFPLFFFVIFPLFYFILFLFSFIFSDSFFLNDRFSWRKWSWYFFSCWTEYLWGFIFFYAWTEYTWLWYTIFYLREYLLRLWFFIYYFYQNLMSLFHTLFGIWTVCITKSRWIFHST